MKSPRPRMKFPTGRLTAVQPQTKDKNYGLRGFHGFSCVGSPLVATSLYKTVLLVIRRHKWRPYKRLMVLMMRYRNVTCEVLDFLFWIFILTFALICHVLILDYE